jgi:hypothetical protein
MGVGVRYPSACTPAMRCGCKLNVEKLTETPSGNRAVTQGNTPALAPSHYDNTGHIMPRGISDHGPRSAALGQALPAHGLRSLPAARHSPSACHDLDAAPPLSACRERGGRRHPASPRDGAHPAPALRGQGAGGHWDYPARVLRCLTRATHACPGALGLWLGPGCPPCSGTTRGAFRWRRMTERLLLGSNVSQAVPRNLLLERGPPMVQ